MHLTPILMTLMACLETTTAPPSSEAMPPPDPSPAPAPAAVPISGPIAAPGASALQTLPTPFTQAQMRAGWVPGVAVRFRMEVAGEPTTLHDWEVLSSPDADHVETAVTVRNEEDGSALAPTMTRVLSYEELRQHAAFPSERATMEDALVEGPSGPLPGRRYTVRSQEDRSQVVTFEFADALPGPPVLMQTRKGDDVIQSMKMVARSGGETPIRP